MAGRLLREGEVERKGAMVVALICAAVACGVVWGAEAAVEPSAGPSGQDERCSRPLSDVLQGFAVTILAFLVSLWGAAKQRGSGYLRWLFLPLIGIFTPFIQLGMNLRISGECLALLWRCQNFPNGGSSLPRSVKWKRFFVSLLPWEQSRVRILASCDVVLYIPHNSILLQNERFRGMTSADVTVQDESEAMEVGDPRGGYTHRQVLWVGKSALELALTDELPPYDHIKFVRGNSSFAMLAIAIQAIGYIYAMLYRTFTGLKVAPVEVIGLVINIVLLINTSMFFICNPCHRPLVIHMNEENEVRLNTFLSTDSAVGDILRNHSNIDNWALGLIISVIVGLDAILVVYIVRMMGHVDKMIIIPIVMFLVVCCLIGVILLPMLFKIEFSNPTSLTYIFGMISVIVVVLDVIVYIWAIVVTIVYWNYEHLNVRAELLNISQLIPFIG